MKEIIEQLQEDIKEAYAYFKSEEHFDEVFNQAGKQSPSLLKNVYSASSMWAANAATFSPSIDSYDKNIRRGDIITELGNEKVNNVDEYNKVLEAYKTGDALMIRIISNGNPRYEAFEIN